MAITPHTTPYHCDRICEGWSLFRVPGSSPNRHHLTLDQSIGQQRHQREQSEQQRRAARYCQVAPLALRFDASDNVAKPLIEFAVNIPRERLRPSAADRRRHH
jgi:hypothetical protein